MRLSKATKNIATAVGCLYAGYVLGIVANGFKTVLVDKMTLEKDEETGEIYWIKHIPAEVEETDEDNTDDDQEVVDEKIDEFHKNREEMDPVLKDFMKNGGVLGQDVVDKLKPNRATTYQEYTDTYTVDVEEVEGTDGAEMFVPNKLPVPDDTHFINEEDHDNRPADFSDTPEEWFATGDQEICALYGNTFVKLGTEMLMPNEMFNDIFARWDAGEFREGDQIWLRIPLIHNDVVLTFTEDSTEELDAIPDDEYCKQGGVIYEA